VTLRPSTRFDLHLHTRRSDGRFDAAEVLRRCAAGGLEVVALTDHDLAADVQPGEHDIDGHRLQVIAGAEVSGTHEGREYHLLVYFPGEVPLGFRDFCRLQCQARADRFAAAVQSLQIPGIDGPDDAAWRGERALTRFHLARTLVDMGHAPSTGDAFARYLDHGLGHVPVLGLSFLEAIRVARAFGGLTSWAHPPLAAVKQHVETFAAAGLQGLEAVRPHVNAKARKVYKKAAKRHGLFLTGGSDWHGWKDPKLGLFQVQAWEISDFVDALYAA
jgi:predicted metal-dependent phosphoesterase TrpH